MIKLNNAGQSLMSALISISISAIVILVVMSITDQQNKSLKIFQIQSELIEQKNYIQNIFNNVQTCDWQFSSLTQTLDTTVLNSQNELVSSLSLQKIYSGLNTSSLVIAEVGKELGLTKLIVNQIKYENIKPAGTPDYYVGDLLISFNQQLGTMAFKPITIKKTVILNSADPATAKTVASCAGGIATLPPYPSQCNLIFNQSDNHGPSINPVIYQMSKPGFKGKEMLGNVDSNDKFFIGGSCSSTPSGSMEEYISQCSFGIGMRDNTENSNYTTNGLPERSIDQPMSSTTLKSLSITGDLDSNDSFYFRFRCPVATNENAKYFFNNCYVCFGQSDFYIPTPTVKACASITNTSSSAWTRFRFTGNVDDNDIIYLGFYCQNPAGDVVHSIQQ